MSNDPKVLVEFSPDEIKWLADLLHDRWHTFSAMKANWADSEKHVEKANTDQAINNAVRNRLLDNTSKQGFGDL